MFSFRLAIVLALSGAGIGGAAHAQTLGAVEHRLDKLEDALRKLQHKRITPEEERAEPTVPVTASPVPDAQLDRRLGALELQVQNMVRVQEILQHDLEGLISDQASMKSDVEDRLTGLESERTSASANDETSGSAVIPSGPSSDVSAADPALAADDQYLRALAFANSQAWSKAEFTFSTFLADHPDHPKVPEAKFWLGRSFAATGRAVDAAKLFLELFQNYPDAPFAMDNLLYLASSLAAVGSEGATQACSVYDELDATFGKQLDVERRDAILAERLKLDCK